MAKSAVPPTATDDEVRALLILYRCPVPFHEVRTRFLGNIASPGIGGSPIKVVEGLWGGKFPEFKTIDAANELVGALVMGGTVTLTSSARLLPPCPPISGQDNRHAQGLQIARRPPPTLAAYHDGLS